MIDTEGARAATGKIWLVGKRSCKAGVGKVTEVIRRVVLLGCLECQMKVKLEKIGCAREVGFPVQRMETNFARGRTTSRWLKLHVTRKVTNNLSDTKLNIFNLL